jgi:mono/diheme cytochrome c family protein
MRPIKIAAAVLGLMVISVPGIGYTQGVDIGKREYYAHCEVCHGVTGKGDGYFARELVTRVPDLTTISQRNNGVFPFKRVYEFIDGTQVVGAHGGEMPIWGDYYKAAAAEYYMPYSDALLRARILALSEYVYSLQAKK